MSGNIEDTFILIEAMVMDDDDGDLDNHADLIQSTRRIIVEELS